MRAVMHKKHAVSSNSVTRCMQLNAMLELEPAVWSVEEGGTGEENSRLLVEEGADKAVTRVMAEKRL